MDEMFEILTLAQTQKLAKKIIVVIYGSEYWKRVINLQEMADTGVISPEDVDLLKIVDSPEEGFEILRDGLIANHLGSQPKRAEHAVPEIAKTNP
jgi:predicted Rossmann-fold nucleotide-binding protein